MRNNVKACCAERILVTWMPHPSAAATVIKCVVVLDHEGAATGAGATRAGAGARAIGKAHGETV